MAERRTGVLWVLLSATSYSLFAVFSKWVLRGLRPTDVLVWRFAIATPLAWSVVLVRRRRGATRGRAPRRAPALPFLAAGGLFGVVALLAFSALDHLSAALYTVVIYTYPAMVAAGSALAGRRPPPSTWIATGVVTLGIALTVPQVFHDPHADGLGLVLTLANAVAYALYILGTSRFVGDTGDRSSTADPSPADPTTADPTTADPTTANPTTDGIAASAWSFTGSLAFALALAAVVGVHLPHGPRAWWGLVGLGVVSTVVAGAAFFVGLGLLGAPMAALVATAEPVLTLVWAMTILGESLVALQVVGAVLVIGGVVWAQRASPVAAVEPG